jgi:heat shock protein 4
MSAGRASLWFGVLLGFVSPLAEAAGSSVGIDIGGANSVIATARNGGIDVIVNEASRRQTPSMVGFNDQQRLLGQSAMSQQTSRPEDTVAEIKALLGLTFEMARQVTPTPTANLRQLDTDDGRAEDCAVEVHLRGEARCFSATQLLAMLLYQLQRCSALELGTPPSECTIAVPMHFSAAKRRAVLDAAQIAGFRDARLISDGAAVALDYALGRQNLPTSSDYHVAFVDAGYAGVQVCIAAVRRDSAKLLSHAYAPDVGGAVRSPALKSLNAQMNTLADDDPSIQTKICSDGT